MELYNPDLLISADARPHVIAYLLGRGYHDADLAVMPNVQLINAYHKEGCAARPNPDDIQRATAQAVIDTIAALPAGIADEATMRRIAREEIEQSPSQRIEIINGDHIITFDHAVHYQTPLVLQIAALSHAILLVGPAGCGKTTIGEHAARALQLTFYITPVVSDTHELLGFVDGHGVYHTTPFRVAYETGGLWVADEIDAWDASALLAANSALANGYCNFPDAPLPVARHADFRMIATANTFGTGADRIYIGRNEMDAASLDRFATINVDYDLDLERQFAGKHDRWLERVWKVRRLVNEKRIRHVVSSRAIAMGAAALSIGIDWDTVEEIYLCKGMSRKDREKIEI